MDKEIRKVITQDWAQLFPELEIYKTLTLYKRIGPCLLGIHLEDERGNVSYRPWIVFVSLTDTFKEGNFLRPLSIWQLYRSAKGAVSSVETKFHKLKYIEAAERLASQSLIPLVGKVNLKAVLEAYEKWLPGSRHEGLFSLPVAQYEHMIQLSTYFNNREYSEKLLESLFSKMKDWSEDRLRIFMNSLNEWYSCQKELISNPKIIQDQVALNIRRFKLEKLPAFEIEIVG